MNSRITSLYKYLLLATTIASLNSVPLKAQVAFDLPPHPAVNSITENEYFFDQDPGAGNGTPIAGGAGTFAVNVTGLSSGVHILHVRTKNNTGQYSTTNSRSFFKDPGSALITAGIPREKVMQAEYFFDTDPGNGNGIAFGFAADTVVSATVATNVSGLATGMHTFFVRTRDSAGRYSLSHYGAFHKAPPSINVQSHPQRPIVTRAEYFFDTDPGAGNGISFAFTPDTILDLAAMPALVSGLSDSVHSFHIRIQDTTGLWSLTSHSTFALISPIHLPSHPATDSFVSFEYFFDHDPGFGNGTQVPVPATTGVVNFPIVLNTSGLSDSIHTLFIRTVNDWSLTQATTFQMGNPLPVSWLSFTANRIAGKVQLQWKVIPGENNSYYEVERSSDGKYFQPIGTVKALNQNADVELYDHTDGQPLDKLSYYRLKQVDTDGQFRYSPTIAVRFSAGQGVLALNNPAKGTLNITGGHHLPVNSLYELIGVSGKPAMHILSNGSTVQSIPIVSLAAGHYLLRYVHAGNVCTLRFIKE